MILSLPLWRLISSSQAYLTNLLALSAVIGDILVQYSQQHVYRAVFDNTTHAIIGGLSWLIVCLNYRDRNAPNTLLEIIACTAISSMIDLDHFWMARSLSLKDATNLKHRPPLHATTIPLLGAMILFFIAYLTDTHSLQRYSLIVFTAFGTHHTRDATRRGYWLYPFGSTPPIPYYSYVLITLFIPYLISGIFYLFKAKRTEISLIDI